MGEIPEGNQGQSQPSAPKHIPLLSSNNPCIWIPLTRALALAFGVGLVYLILIPTEFLPDYIALPLAFAAGMILWGFLVGFPSKKTRRFWSISALLWGAGVCLVYADAFRQHHHELNGWYWVGVGLQILAAILGIVYYLTDKAKKAKS